MKSRSSSAARSAGDSSAKDGMLTVAEAFMCTLCACGVLPTWYTTHKRMAVVNTPSSHVNSLFSIAFDSRPRRPPSLRRRANDLYLTRRLTLADVVQHGERAP